MRPSSLIAPLFVLCLLTLAPHVTRAQDLDEDDDPIGYYDDTPKDPAWLTLSFSPLHLLIPMGEVQAEVRILDWLSLAALGGYGSVPGKTADDDTLHFRAWEVGGQVVAYPSEEVFHGLQLGLESLYMHLAIEDEIGSERVSGLGAGLSVSPFVGYKWISEPGFSVFIQGGISVLVITAHAKNDLGQSAVKKENQLLPLLNINLGWSF